MKECPSVSKSLLCRKSYVIFSFTYPVIYLNLNYGTIVLKYFRNEWQEETNIRDRTKYSKMLHIYWFPVTLAGFPGKLMTFFFLLVQTTRLLFYLVLLNT